jgi:hypothetical protein
MRQQSGEGFIFPSQRGLWVALSFVTVAYFVQMLSWSLIMQYRGISPGTESHGTGVLSFFSPPLHSRKCLGVLEPK